MPSASPTFVANLEKLIAKFEADKTYYLSKGYSEAQARVDLITPFFKALGWDVENDAGLPHHAREVIVERGETGAEGRPDYNFRVGGQTKFFVEAKAPSEPLDAPRHILQAKGYACNARRGCSFGRAVFPLAWSPRPCDDLGPAVFALSRDSSREQILAETTVFRCCEL